MEYTTAFKKITSLFSSDKSEIGIPDSGIKIINANFRSEEPFTEFISRNDALIPENQSFSYPVFVPRNSKSTRVILLFHGLNERSWQKYLAWAYWLAVQTDSYVILFPISFHINRSPSSWKDPRVMSGLLKENSSSGADLCMSSFANIALSNRLSEDPLRFFKSGYQTVNDIVKLAESIRNGTHPVVPESNRINIFAYSIGAFLAEIIMMGNPGNLFSKSRLFIFCGGSVFSNMQGASKYIMDNRAFNRVHRFYLNDFEKIITGKSRMAEFLRSSQTGISFRAMIDLERFKIFRENILRKLRDQILTITLVKDRIIPAKGVTSTLGKFIGDNNLKVWDFPYSYSHENPFPVFDSPGSREVDLCFERVFSEAALFLA
jgi:Family of unknown function (DUF6051)